MSHRRPQALCLSDQCWRSSIIRSNSSRRKPGRREGGNRNGRWFLRGRLVLILGLAVLAPAALETDRAYAQTAPAPTAPTEEQTKQQLETPTEPTRPLPSQIEHGGLLVGKGKWELEERLSYAHFSRNVIFIDGVAILPVLVVGEIAVERIRRDILIGALTGRYGVSDNLQVELKVPYRYQHDLSSIPEATPPRENTLSDSGLGDVEGAVFHQLPQRASAPTKYILGLHVKSRTGKDIFKIDPHREVPMGSGFWNTRLSLTAVRVSDPAVLFGTVAYTHNFPRKDLTITTEDPETGEPIQETVSFFPGGSVEMGFGLAYALNPRVSLSSQFSASWTAATDVSTIRTGRIPVSGTTLTVGSFRLGGVWVSSERCTTELSVNLGLTLDAPDMLVEMRRTYRF